MIRDVALLVNPVAGRGRARRLAVRARAELLTAGASVRLLVGRSGWESVELAADAVRSGCEALLVCGGDGTIANALPAVAGSDVPLGVLAAGSGNDFARMLDVPLGDPVRAARIVLKGRTRRVDLGRAADRWFGTVLATGFDSRVNERMNRMRVPLGGLKYHAAIVGELVAFRPIPYSLVKDGRAVEVEAMLVAVGNGPSYGGGMRICPDARVDDGLLNVTVVKAISRATLMRLFPTVYSGRHVLQRCVETFQCSTLTIDAPSVSAFADGEFIAPLPVSCSVGAQALRVLVP